MFASLEAGKSEYIVYSLFFFAKGQTMEDKPFKTVGQQIDLLNEQRNLNIQNMEAAKNALKRYGYYEIINGYKEPFLVDADNDDTGYLSEANFEHIFALFTLDKHIRELTLQGLEEFENTFKQAVAYVVSECVSSDMRHYTAKSHFNRGRAYKQKDGSPKRKPPRNDREKLLWRFEWLSKANIQPFAYYREEHQNIPPWIMVKGLTFGEVIYWYSLSKKPVRDKVIGRLLGLDPALIDSMDKDSKIRQAVGDVLALMLDYRNLTAHGGRVYNHRSKKHALRASPYLLRKSILDTSMDDFNHGRRRSSLGALLVVLRIFENPDPYATIQSWLGTHLAQYLRNYPDDENMLIGAMELEDSPVLSTIRKTMKAKVTISYDD